MSLQHLALDRNVTCYWSLRQKDIPTCKHAMISVRQEYSHKMQIKRSISMARSVVNIQSFIYTRMYNKYK